MTVSGIVIELQICEATTGKARPPMVDRGKFEIRYFLAISGLAVTFVTLVTLILF